MLGTYKLMGAYTADTLYVKDSMSKPKTAKMAVMYNVFSPSQARLLIRLRIITDGGIEADLVFGIMCVVKKGDDQSSCSRCCGKAAYSTKSSSWYGYR
jgi:hypothetical protein